ncbi:MAG: tyrosine-type recombinase/integrase [Acidimicrobiales bacterium]
MARARRLSSDAPLPQVIDAWLFQLGARKPSARTLAAYRSDVEGVARRVDSDGAAALRIEDLTKPALRAGFASWAADHAAASLLRAHSAWSSMFDFLVAEDLVYGNPMAAVPKPRLARSAPKAIRAEDAAVRLLATAAAVDTRARHPWPQRDLALVALFLVSGIREGEAVALGMASIAGPDGARRLEVTGKGDKTRTIPVDPALEHVLATYQASRIDRFPDHDLDQPATPLLVDALGRRLAAHQISYLIERLYTRAGIRARIPTGAMVHALRHTFATDALQAGADVVELQALLGHASLDTTRRYLDASAEGLRDVIRGHPGQIALRDHLRRDPAQPGDASG